jgi:hypothetical protein
MEFKAPKVNIKIESQRLYFIELLRCTCIFSFEHLSIFGRVIHKIEMMRENNGIKGS